MGRKERREREEKRENYATKHTAQKQKQTLIAVAVFAVIGVIVAYAVVQFVDQSQGNSPGGPADAGALGSAHTHTAILVKIFGDKFDFSTPAYQIKSSWIHFEGSDGTTIHKHAEGVTLGYLFETLALKIDEECFVFTDGREFCNDDQYTLAYYVNGEPVEDIREHEPMEGDRVLVSYGAETPEQLQSDLLELESQPLVK
ncbi:MAG: protein-disulfide isomerase [Nitrosopumilus sp. H8]|nr:MAG: protein-disulfide isomerase [Nitrosopumilus sp. H8]